MFTEKGKPKSMHKLLNELSHMIKKHPVDVIKQTKKPLHQRCV